LTGESLTGIRVLVTRPQQQQQAFSASLIAAGAAVTRLPVIAIHALNPPDSALQQLKNIDSADVVIFTSANAVHYAHALKPLPWSAARSPLAVLAAGPATARELARYNMPLAAPPSPPYNSESLLALTTLQNTNLQKVAIVKGQGGRQLLQQTLSNRGVSIDLIDVYQRRIAKTSRDALDRAFLNYAPDIVTITSDEALRNLVTITGQRYQETLLSLPLVVNSERCAALAQQLGFRSHILVADVPGDFGQLAAINQWNRSYRLKL